MIITIDGPSFSGKSTTSRALAQRLGYQYLYSGLLFRALAYVLLHDEHLTSEQLEMVDHNTMQKYIAQLHYVYDEHARILYKNNDITALLKTASIDTAASILGTNPTARELLCAWQRDIARDGNIIVDGRDAGSVVFPAAELKIYLTASAQARARRCLLATLKQDQTTTADQLQCQIEERDARDMQRTVDPLIVPQDALIIDNSHMGFEQTLATLEQLAHDAGINQQI